MVQAENKSCHKPADCESVKAPSEDNDQDSRLVIHDDTADKTPGEQKKKKQHPIVALYLLGKPVARSNPSFSLSLCYSLLPFSPKKKLACTFSFFPAAPVMTLTLLITSLIVERPFNTLPNSQWFSTRKATLDSIAIITSSGVLATLLSFLEFQVLKVR